MMFTDVPDWTCHADVTQHSVSSLQFLGSAAGFEPCVCSLRPAASDDVAVLVKHSNSDIDDQRITLTPGTRSATYKFTQRT